ncbi:MAG: 4-hydroxythreonine-4-phosphate dehydrogenase PdxA, partial [Halieaceae bacterium]
MTIKLVLTSGEPAGIGPDLVLAAAMKTWEAGLVALGDRALFASRAVELGMQVELIPYSSSDAPSPHRPGTLPFIHIPLSNPCRPGQLDPTNASYVMAQLDMAMSLCQAGECAGMVTAPVHKAVINDAGIAFSGHTEYLAATTGAEKVVMMLTAGDLRVALATTHLPLRAVPDAIDSASLTETLRVMNNALQSRFGLKTPRITVLGLNPHAGESGHLGWEE